MKQSTCKSCGASIYWVKMEKTGHLMPIDADSIKISLVVNDKLTKGAIRKTATTHFSTCPNEKEHRKEKK